MERITYIFILFALITSCDENNCNDVDFCTEQLETVFVSVEDEAGTHIALDSTGTFKNNQLVYKGTNEEPNATLYPVLSDMEMSEVDRSGTTLEFIGWKDGAVLIEESFIIGHDCCHIVKKDGPETITATLD